MRFMKLTEGLLFSILLVISFVTAVGAQEMAAVPSPPVILRPAEIEQFPGANSVEVTWEEVPGEFTHLVLGRDRAFRRIVYENEKIPGTFFLIENLDYGTYFLRIRAISEAGRGGPFSEARTFIVTPPSPKTIMGTIP